MQLNEIVIGNPNIPMKLIKYPPIKEPQIEPSEPINCKVVLAETSFSWAWFLLFITKIPM